MNDQPQIRFDDGAAYENFMGVWSRKVGEIFLDWLKPEPGLSWIDVGCGNGAFTELLVERAKAARVLGIDPSEGQLSFARERHKAGVATFEQGDAMALEAKDKSFDAAVMALVLFFVPQPPKGVSELVRVTKPGGLVSAYLWDLPGGGFPLHVIHEELLALDLPSPVPPSPEISALDALEQIWRVGGLKDVETKIITVERSFPDYETLWQVQMSGPRLSMVSKSLDDTKRAMLKANVRKRLSPAADGSITTKARAHAVKGRAP